MHDFRRQYAAIPQDDEEAKTEFKLMLYNKYYFSPTLIGRVVGKPAKTIRLWLVDWEIKIRKFAGENPESIRV